LPCQTKWRQTALGEQQGGKHHVGVEHHPWRR
jgi:hypothetical protein